MVVAIFRLSPPSKDNFYEELFRKMLEHIQTLKLTYLDFRTKLQITTRYLI